MDIQQVLQFWFGLTVGPETPSNQAGLWWSKQPEIDLQIRQKFADGLQALVRGEHSDWLQTASGRLADYVATQRCLAMHMQTQPRCGQTSLCCCTWSVA